MRRERESSIDFIAQSNRQDILPGSSFLLCSPGRTSSIVSSPAAAWNVHLLPRCSLSYIHRGSELELGLRLIYSKRNWQLALSKMIGAKFIHGNIKLTSLLFDTLPSWQQLKPAVPSLQSDLMIDSSILARSLFSFSLFVTPITTPPFLWACGKNSTLADYNA